MNKPRHFSEATRTKLTVLAFIAGMLVGNGLTTQVDAVSTEQAKCEVNFGKDYDARLRRCIAKPSKP